MNSLNDDNDISQVEVYDQEQYTVILYVIWEQSNCWPEGEEIVF